MIRYGIVGCGAAGQSHMAGIATVPEARMVAAADVDAATLESAGARFGIAHLYTDYREMFEREELDAVAVITPGCVHHPVVMAAAASALHVICEKPIATDLDEAREMVAAMNAAGKLLAITFTYRFVPDTRYIHEVVTSGALGQVRELRFTSLTGLLQPPAAGTPERARMDRFFASGLGLEFDCGVHRWDLFRWCAGSEYRRIEAFGTWHWGYDFPEGSAAVAEFENGVRAVYDHGAAPFLHDDHGYYFRFIATGDQGTLLWNFAAVEQDGRRCSAVDVHTAAGKERRLFPIYSKERDTQHRQFCESIQAGRLVGHFPPAEDAIRATEGALWALRSAKGRREA